MRQNPILFCTVCDDQFLSGALVMLRSLSDFIPHFNTYRLKIFFDNEISPLSRQSQSLISEVIPHAEFEPIANTVYRNAKVKVEAHRVAYLTLELFRQAEFHRVVYFDVDMLCLNDFSDLFEHSSEFMACTRWSQDNPEDRFVRWTNPTMPPRNLLSRIQRKVKWMVGRNHAAEKMIEINSGFMVIGNRYLGHSTYHAMNEMIRNRDSELNLLDQHIINQYFQRLRIPIRLLPMTYNFRPWGGGDGSNDLFERFRDQIKLLHFSGYDRRPKPWQPEASEELAAIRVWREYARDRLGSDFVDSLLGTVRRG